MQPWRTNMQFITVDVVSNINVINSKEQMKTFSKKGERPTSVVSVYDLLVFLLAETMLKK